MLLYAGRIMPQKGWRMDHHVHPDHDELIVVLEGAMRVRLGGKELVAKAGEVLHYPAGQAHQERAIGEEPLETLYVGFRAPIRLALPAHTLDPDGYVAQAARWMIKLTTSGTPADMTVADHLLQAVFHEIRSTAGNINQPDPVHRVQRYIEYHLTGRLALRNLASEAGLSVFHFARLFTAETGQSPGAYVRAARVRAAKVLLTTTSLPLRTIATLVGFSDQPQLSKAFRQVTGQTPGAYRKACSATVPRA